MNWSWTFTRSQLRPDAWPHYHEPTDTPEKLNYAKMSRIQALVSRLLRKTSAHPLAGPFEGFDTTAAEIELLERALGSHVRRSGAKLESRADIERLIRSLRSRGL